MGGDLEVITRPSNQEEVIWRVEPSRWILAPQRNNNTPPPTSGSQQRVMPPEYGDNYRQQRQINLPSITEHVPHVSSPASVNGGQRSGYQIKAAKGFFCDLRLRTVANCKSRNALQREFPAFLHRVTTKFDKTIKEAPLCPI